MFDQSPYFQESRKLIENYFETPKESIREAKVIFLGDGKVGKTYTIQRLLHHCHKGDYPTKETHGILIEDLYTEKNGESYKIRIWDFGGQNIMHEIHRRFLTDRTCYVVMVDTQADKQTGRARYWLRTVQNIAPETPVLLLVNEISGGRNLDLDYIVPTVKEYMLGSAQTRRGFALDLPPFEEGGPKLYYIFQPRLLYMSSADIKAIVT